MWGPVVFLMLLCLQETPGFAADAPAFDLLGPKIDVHVQREGKTLPIAEVPNLLPGDRLWVHPDLPATQSTHYVLVVVFLRGATNPPPPDWFKRVETWNPQVRQEGVFVVVPAEAQQALLFLAPETIGDFSTLRKAVHDRPGSFVRAAEDLQQASWDRLRLDAYLAEVKAMTASDLQLATQDPKALKERTELAARSLGIRVDQQCFDKPTEQQAPCLVQHTEGLVLDDSNAQSIVTQMANGSAADMMNQLSYSTIGGAGQFSPYVGAVVDLARILSSIHTAHFQYIPALALPTKEHKDTLNLRLNVPPSFRDPKSVIVVALPPVGPTHPPQLMPARRGAGGAQTAYCATKPDLTLEAEGAPLVFGTALAYDLTLHLETKAKPLPNPQLHADPAHPELLKAERNTSEAAGQNSSGSFTGMSSTGIDIPLAVDLPNGGFTLQSAVPPLPESEVTAELRGKWGFDTFAGPKFRLSAPRDGGWAIAGGDQNALIIGRDDALHLQGEGAACVEKVEATLPEEGRHAAPIALTWKPTKADQIEATVPLKDAAPGKVTIAVHQFGLAKPDELSLLAYAEAAALEHLTLSAGDKTAVLKGKRLDEVQAADLAGITFAPAALNRVQDFDQLAMSATGVTATLEPGKYSAKVTLRDGRQLHVPATVEVSRPQVELLSKGIQHEEPTGDAPAPQIYRLGSVDDLPLQGRLVIFLRSRVPAAFSRSEKIEIASAENAKGDSDGNPDSGFRTTLSFADGSLILEDAHTAVAVLDPLARFGPSAFGPLQLRAVTASGVTGDWVPLGTLVRLPGFTAPGALRCPHNPAKPCQLSGSNLFLVTAVSASPDMADEVEVPGEFAGASIAVPNVARAGGNGSVGTLYLRLRDDPDTVQAVNLPVTLGGLAAKGADASAVPLSGGSLTSGVAGTGQSASGTTASTPRP
jgi:hypothetical protein